jgi:1,4-dihydroxy-2-naphthoate octaprenyltransferase
MDLQGHKSTLISRHGRRFGFVGLGLSLILASLFFFVFPLLSPRAYPLDFRILGLFSLLPLAAGVTALIKKPLEIQPATRIVNATVFSIAVFFILVDVYLYTLVTH